MHQCRFKCLLRFDDSNRPRVVIIAPLSTTHLFHCEYRIYFIIYIFLELTWYFQCLGGRKNISIFLNWTNLFIFTFVHFHHLSHSPHHSFLSRVSEFSFPFETPLEKSTNENPSTLSKGKSKQKKKEERETDDSWQDGAKPRAIERPVNHG